MMTSLSESQILQFPLPVKFQILKHEESFKWLCFWQKGVLSFFSRESGSDSASTFQNEANKLYPHKNYVMENCIFAVRIQTVSGLSRCIPRPNRTVVLSMISILAFHIPNTTHGVFVRVQELGSEQSDFRANKSNKFWAITFYLDKVDALTILLK